MKTFAERKATLERLGWKVSVETEYRGEVPRQPHNLEIFKSVRLPLTPRDWCRLCMRESEDYLSVETEEGTKCEYSEYVGGCCGNMSAVQDTLNGWFRDGGWVEVRDLVELGEAMRDHGDESFEELSPEKLTEAVDNYLKFQEQPKETQYWKAWGKIALLYHLVKDHYVPEAKTRGQYGDTLEQSFKVVSRMAWTFGMGDFFTRDRGTSATTDNAQKTMRLFRFVPALHEVYERVRELAPEPVEGWAIVDEEHNGDVAENGYGMCVYATKREAQRIIDLFKRAEEEYEEKPSRNLENRFKLRAVRISVDKGLEFLEPGTQPRPKIKKRRRPHWLEEETDSVEELFEQYTKSWDDLDKDQNERRYEIALRTWKDAAAYFDEKEG